MVKKRKQFWCVYRAIRNATQKVNHKLNRVYSKKGTEEEIAFQAKQDRIPKCTPLASISKPLIHSVFISTANAIVYIFYILWMLSMRCSQYRHLIRFKYSMLKVIFFVKYVNIVNINTILITKWQVVNL